MKIRKHYDKKTGIHNSNTIGETRTKQEFKNECDINRIVNKYHRTGQMPQQKVGMFADVSNLGTFQESLQLVTQADKDFKGLRSEIRNRFNNNPQELIEFLEDDSNYDEACKLGLIVKKSETPEKPKKEPEKVKKDEPKKEA